MSNDSSFRRVDSRRIALYLPNTDVNIYRLSTVTGNNEDVIVIDDTEEAKTHS